jgi:hypothetical protein
LFLVSLSDTRLIPQKRRAGRVWHRLFTEQKCEPIRWRVIAPAPSEVFKILIYHDILMVRWRGAWFPCGGKTVSAVAVR